MVQQVRDEGWYLSNNYRLVDIFLLLSTSLLERHPGHCEEVLEVLIPGGEGSLQVGLHRILTVNHREKALDLQHHAV